MMLDERSSGETGLCHECGTKISPSDPFCGLCGAAQRRRSDDTTMSDNIASRIQAADLGETLTEPPEELKASEPARSSEEINGESTLHDYEGDEAGEAAEPTQQSNELAVTHAPDGAHQTGEIGEEQPVQPTVKADTTGCRAPSSAK